MKKLLFLISILFLFSCGNQSTKELTPEEKKYADSIRNATREQEEANRKLNDYKNLKQSLINSLKDLETHDFSDKSTRDKIEYHVRYIELTGDDVLDGEMHDSTEIKELAKKLRKKLVPIQEREFKSLRKEYGNVSAIICWEDNITVTVNGTSITYTGAYFASNKNISDWHKTLSSMLRLLRFKRVNYKWFKYDTDYTYFTLNSPNDNEIVRSKPY